MSRQFRWRYKANLSRHWEWRDQNDLPRHQVQNSVLTGLGHTMARQSGLVAPTPLARQMPRPVMTWPSLSRHAGWRDKANIQGPRRPLLPHPPFLSLTPPRPEQQQVVAAGRPTPQIPPNPAFWVGESWGKRSPHFPEGIAPIFSSFNRAHLKILGILGE